MKDSSSREVWIDTVRGLAILFIVFAHIDMGNHPLNKWIYSFHVPLFFILSGFLVAKRYESYTKRPLPDLLWAKTKQYLYPYLTFSVIALLYAYSISSAGAINVLRYTFTLEGYSTLWFLPALWLAESALLILLRSRLSKKWWIPLLALGTSLYASLQYYAIGGAEPFAIGIHYAVLNLFCRSGIGCLWMVFGFYVHDFLRKWMQSSRREGTCLAIVTGIIGFVFGMQNGVPDLHYSVLHNPIFYYLSAGLQGIAILLLCAYWGRKSKFIAFLGRNSLIIMATHYTLPLIRLTSNWITPLKTGLRYIDDLFILIGVMAMEVVIIWIVHHFFPCLCKPCDLKRFKQHSNH